MSPRFLTALAGLVCGFLAPLGQEAARAGAVSGDPAVDAKIRLGDRFRGEVISNADVDVLRFEALGGTLLDVEVKASAGSTLLPALLVVDRATGLPLALEGHLFGAGSSSLELEGLPLTATSSYELRFSGATGSRGAYEVKTAGAIDSSLLAFEEDAALDPAEPLRFELPLPKGARVTITASRTDGSAAKPSFEGVDSPQGAIAIAKYHSTTKKSATLKNLPVKTTGEHVFTIGDRGAGGGAIEITVKIAMKAGKKLHVEDEENKKAGSIAGEVLVPPMYSIAEIAGPNETVATAQYVGSLTPASAIRIRGRIEATDDAFDAYRVTVPADVTAQIVLVHDVATDFEFGLFDVATQAYLDPLLDSALHPEMGQIGIANPGTYLLVVYPFEGDGPYHLMALGVENPAFGAQTLAGPNAPGAPGAPGAAAEKAAPPVRRRAPAPSPGRLLELDVPARDDAFVVTLRPVVRDARGFFAAQGFTVLLESPSGSSLVTPRQFAPGVPQRRELARHMERLRGRPEVESLHLDYRHAPCAATNDPLLPLQWNLDLLRVSSAWHYSSGSSATVVAIADTGTLPHPDLAARDSQTGFDFVSDPNSAGDGNGLDPDPRDEGDFAGAAPLASSWHGSYVQGIVAAVTGNARGIAGVDRNCRVMPLRVLGRKGGSDFDVAEAVRYAARLPNASGVVPPQRANVLLMSFATENPSANLASAIADAQAAGVTIVAAAGNHGGEGVRYPAGYEGVIGVAALDSTGGVTDYSGRGSHVDLAAPGGSLAADADGDGHPDGVLSAVHSDLQSANAYEFREGTSGAAAHVAGVASLLLALRPQAMPGEVAAYLASSAVDLAPAGFDSASGHGRVDAFAALALAADFSAPLLQLASPALDFGSIATLLDYQVVNAGGSTLAYAATVIEGSAWLTAPGTGVLAPGQAATLTASVDRQGLPIGVHTGRIAIESEAASVMLEVALTVAPGTPSPKLEVSTASLDHGPHLSSLDLVLHNAGASSLTFVMQEVVPPLPAWLALSATIGMLAPGEERVIQVTVDRTGLAAGAYGANLRVFSNGGEHQVAVKMVVAAGTTPQLAIAPQDAIELGASQDGFQLQLVDLGGGALPFTASVATDDGAAWLTATPLAGSTPALLAVAIDRSGLAAGRYTGRIDVATSAGHATLDVAIDVLAVPPTPLAAGAVRVISVHPETGAVLAAASLPGAGGSFALEAVPVGSCFVVAGIDLDGDGIHGGLGEPAGVFPGVGDAAKVVVTSGGAVTGLAFSIVPASILPAGPGD
jgi:hypothetical protein